MWVYHTQGKDIPFAKLAFIDKVLSDSFLEIINKIR